MPLVGFVLQPRISGARGADFADEPALKGSTKEAVSVPQIREIQLV